MSEANHNLNRLLDKPGDLIEKSFFAARLPGQAESGPGKILPAKDVIFDKMGPLSGI